MNHIKTTMAVVMTFTLGLSSIALAQQPTAIQAACNTNCDTSNACGCDGAGCQSCSNSKNCTPLRPRIQCGKCNGTCYLKVEQSTKEKSCFKVEAKQICIPRVRFPWQTKDKCNRCDACDSGQCCSTQCGRVKTILVLKKHKYECPACKYSWEIAGGGCCDSANCDGCSSGNCDVDVVPPAVGQAQRGKVQPMVPARPAIATQREVPVGSSTPMIISAEEWRKQAPAKPARSTTNATNR